VQTIPIQQGYANTSIFKQKMQHFRLVFQEATLGIRFDFDGDPFSRESVFPFEDFAEFSFADEFND
jgi:hypothetical protein